MVAKSRSGKNCRGNHLRMGIGKKLLGVERESRVQRSVFVPSRVLYFPTHCNVFVRLKRGGIDALSPAVAKKERSVESSALVALSALATGANETITNCCA